MTRASTITVNALRVVQDRKHPLFMFVLSAKQLDEIAEVRRIGRASDGGLSGYQRGEVRRHVTAIADYLNSGRGMVLFPHALILALTTPVSFSSLRDGAASPVTEMGTLTIPVPKDATRPAFIVDGQQRALALAKAHRRDFPVPVCAFQANDVDTQREQFLRVNSTHPLPRGLVAELVPHVKTELPPKLAASKAPSQLCEILNRDERSPFCGLIRRASYSAEARRKAVVGDTALIKMLAESFGNPSGALFPYRNMATGHVDVDGARKVLLGYWSAVQATFPDAWGLPPTRSRLMHSAGLLAMGKLMDRAMSATTVDARSEQRLRRDLAKLRPRCRWTSGTWEELNGGLAWNELQNVPSHVRMLTDYLQRVYLAG